MVGFLWKQLDLRHERAQIRAISEDQPQCAFQTQAFRKARGDVHQERMTVRGIISIGPSGFLGLMSGGAFLIICWLVCQLQVPHPSQE